MNDNSLKFLDIGEGSDRRRIAVRQQGGSGPGLVWLGGYKSDMKGTKAQALADWASEHGRACLRFDYSGHGESGGAFTDGTIGRWLAESLAVFDAFCNGPQILVGSSMGGWIALLLICALQRRPPPSPPPQAGEESSTKPTRLARQESSNIPPPPAGEESSMNPPPLAGEGNSMNPPPLAGEGRVGASAAGVVLIAPAVDFTEELMWKRFTPEIKSELETKGFWTRPSEYSPDPYIVTKQLIEEGRRHLLLGGMIETGCPVRILQGVEDPDVPWQHAKALVARLASDDVVLTLIKDGDHRLSRPEDIERMIRAVAEF